jgi:hypothetical protein
MSRIDHFKNRKELYLHDHTIVVGKPDYYDFNPRVDYFDLVPDLNTTKTYTLTRPLNPTEGQKKKLIRAAWLPYNVDEAMEIDLNDTAYHNVKYFFTGNLDGCRLEIGCADRPKVIHIAAALGGCPSSPSHMILKKEVVEYNRTMDAIANMAFHGLPHRKYSKRTGYPTAPRFVTVVGYWKQTMWEFYAQEQQVGNDRVTRRVVRQIVTTNQGQGQPCNLV